MPSRLSCNCGSIKPIRNIEDICFFLVKDGNLFHRVNTIGNIFSSVEATWEKLYQNPVQFFSVILCGVPLPHSNTLLYYVKREKCKVNDVIFPSGCEARAINLGNKTVKIGIFTGGTSVREKNIFIHIYRYPTGKHKIKQVSLS